MTPRKAFTTRIVVRDGMDWAEFLVHERPPARDGDGHTRYSATWTCVSSFGVFGHYWSHMGSPFPEFAARIGEDYLLSKIAGQVFDAEKFSRWLRRQIFTSGATREQKREAARELRRLRDDHMGESLATMAYESAEISVCDPEWCDCDSRVWDSQAVSFVRQMWPKFVRELGGRTQASERRTGVDRRWAAFARPARGERSRRSRQART